MKVTVLFFAAARDAVGGSALVVDTPDVVTIQELQKLVLLAAPALERWSDALLWAVNNEYAERTRTIAASDAIACFPPVSGG